MTTQKITIEPVTRIEGHAKVTIHMKDDGSVDHAYMHVNEFRGFEKFCEGRLYFEMPSITPRICGICPVSHHLASAKAGDVMVSVMTLPGVLILVLGYLSMDPLIAKSLHSIVVQLVLGGVVLTMVAGYFIMRSMIQEAV